MGAVFVTVLMVAAVRPAAAFQVPQSRQEFVKAVSEGKGATTTETFTVEQGIDSLYSVLQDKASACLDVEVRRSGWVGGTMESSSSDYNPTLRRVGGRIEFALQVVHRPRGIGENAPPGGLYVMAADITALGKGRSQVTLYRPTIGYGKVADRFRQWARGDDADCPKMK
jgi:hypothetical protein